jgi:hypothetical protein
MFALDSYGLRHNASLWNLFLENASYIKSVLKSRTTHHAQHGLHEAEFGVAKAAGVKQLLVGGFEVEEFGEVFRAGISVEACVKADLFRGEEVGWHGFMLSVI